MSQSKLRVDPAELITAASDLDRIADRLEQALVASGRALPVAPQGRDEVSQAAATSFTAVAEDFETNSATGILEMRKIAAVLRAQAVGFTEGDADAAAAFTAQLG